jgi:hypothetical protein
VLTVALSMSSRTILWKGRSSMRRSLRSGTSSPSRTALLSAVLRTSCLRGSWPTSSLGSVSPSASLFPPLLYLASVAHLNSSVQTELSFGAKLENCSFLELLKWFRHGNESFLLLGSMLWFYKV